MAKGLKYRLVHGFAPSHEWPGIQFHARHSCALHDECGKNGVFISDHRASSTEALDHLDPALLSCRNVDQLVRFPARALVLSR